LTVRRGNGRGGLLEAVGDVRRVVEVGRRGAGAPLLLLLLLFLLLGLVLFVAEVVEVLEAGATGARIEVLDEGVLAAVEDVDVVAEILVAEVVAEVLVLLVVVVVGLLGALLAEVDDAEVLEALLLRLLRGEPLGLELLLAELGLVGGRGTLIVVVVVTGVGGGAEAAPEVDVAEVDVVEGVELVVVTLVAACEVVVAEIEGLDGEQLGAVLLDADAVVELVGVVLLALGVGRRGEHEGDGEEQEDTRAGSRSVRWGCHHRKSL